MTENGIKIIESSTQTKLLNYHLILKGHSNIINHLLNLHNNILASCSVDGEIKFWNILEGYCFRIIKAHNSTIKTMLILDENTVLTYSRDNSIKLWNFRLGKHIKTIIEQSSFHKPIIKLSKQVIAISAEDKSIKLFKIHTQKCIKILKGHLNTIENLYKLNVNSLISCTNDTIIIWDWILGLKLKVFSVFYFLPQAVICFKDFLIIGSSNGKLNIMNWVTEEKIDSVIFKNNSLTNLFKISSDLLAIILISIKGKIMLLWDWRKSKSIRLFILNNEDNIYIKINKCLIASSSFNTNIIRIFKIDKFSLMC